MLAHGIKKLSPAGSKHRKTLRFTTLWIHRFGLLQFNRYSKSITPPVFRIEYNAGVQWNTHGAEHAALEQIVPPIDLG